MFPKKPLFVVSLLLACAFAYPLSGFSETLPQTIPQSVPVQESVQSAVKISMNFDGADLRSIVKFMSELTGKNFLLDKSVQGRVTVYSPRKVSVDEAYLLFESILVMNGFAAVPVDANRVNIIPLAKGPKDAVLNSPESIKGEHYVTSLIPLINKNSGKMVPILKPLMSDVSYIAAYAPTNTLIITDLATKVDQIVEIAATLDEDDMKVAKVVWLKNASAKTLKEKLMEVFTVLFANSVGIEDPKERFHIIADERTNSIILTAREDDVEEMVNVISRLDVEAPKSRGKIHVYRLRNAASEELAKVLASLTQSVGKPSQTDSQSKTEFEGQVSITADKVSNSLIVTASPEDYEIIKGVIEQLDVRQPQVFVEALIMEISTDRANEFGIEWRTTNDFTQSSKVQPIAGANFGGITSTATDPFNQSGLIVGMVKGTITFGGVTYLNLGALLKALQKDTGVNVLSTPNILTSNNEKAEIHVGENIPISVGATSTTVGVTQNIERTDIGIVLKLTPQISDDDYVKLLIYEEISNIVTGSVTADPTNPVTSKRTASTTVVVKDKHVVVIGGLVRDDVTEVNQQIPLLGDIPLLGALFRSSTTTKKKTNLVIFLTPHIIRTPDQLAEISRHKEEEMKRKEIESTESATREYFKSLTKEQK